MQSLSLAFWAGTVAAVWEDTDPMDELFEKYQTDECVRIRIQNEAVFLKQLIEKGMIEDIAF